MANYTADFAYESAVKITRGMKKLNEMDRRRKEN